MHTFVRSFVCSLRAGVQTTLDPSDETFISVQCASPRIGGQLVGVCGVRARCVGCSVVFKSREVWPAGISEIPDKK